MIGLFLPYPTAVKVIEEEDHSVSICGVQDPEPTNVSHPEVTDFIKDTDFPADEGELIKLLEKHRQAVALPGEPLGCTSMVKHSISLQPDSRSVYIPAYCMPHSRHALLDKLVEEMIKEDVIEPSTSPFNSPFFLVPKKSGEWRPVVDFWELNQLTTPDRYPMPLLHDLLQSIGKDNRVFTTLDLVRILAG